MKLLPLLSFIFILTSNTEGVSQKAVKVSSKGVSTTKTTTKPVNKAKIARIRFAQTNIDLGTLKENAIVEKTFSFVNEGNMPLLIISAQGSCGCTVPTFSKEPIPPAGKGVLTVKYTAKNMMGPQKKTITVVTNGKPRIVKLQIEGWVEQIPGGIKE